MPERFRRGAFEPDFVAMLVDVFETVCRQLEAQRGADLSVEFRDRIAKAIMNQAEQGTTEAAVIERAAFKAVEGDVEVATSGQKKRD